MKSADIRAAFLNYFQEQQHTVVESSALIPGNDPTLLFTNAGMVQFKDVFLGRDPRDYTRATSSQRCVRAGGKHNDLENVGYTARHHTFFEMLGNFSFGDYFKREAIRFAWEFLTEVLKLPEDKLWVTVYKDDQEAEDIWFNDMGIDQTRFSRLGEKDNFWAMGDTGPCGPSSEIFYDHGPDVPGGPPGSPDDDGDRYIEIWNLVFMQYERAANGELTPLPNPSIDTGMGLERVAAVMQGVHSNYEIDLFQNLLAAVAEVTGVSDTTHTSQRVIADHIRSCAFLVVDGVIPSNEGRGYVLRRIIRRALRHGHKLGVTEPFFHKLVASLVKEMGVAYPELVSAEAHVVKVLLAEEEQFAKTLDKGMKILEQDIATLKGDTLPGATLFALYDTYGFPVDLTADIARERQLQVDMEGFERAMEDQRARARSASQFDANYHTDIELDGETLFKGYDALRLAANIDAVIKAGEQVTALASGDSGMLVLDETPFYAESGGQVGDKGTIVTGQGEFRVDDTAKLGKRFVHKGTVVSGRFSQGDEVSAEVSESSRRATMLNHSATHLLHAALRQILGSHVTQKGSLVDAERLRFDFSHMEAVSAAQLVELEALVNRHIRLNSPVQTEIMALDAAKAKGAMALFGEKYDTDVRVLTMGDGFSVELCGGTHVNRTGDIGLFKIVAESGIAAGVRRIEAVTGEAALAWVNQHEAALQQLAGTLKTSMDGAPEKVQQLLERNRQLEKALEQAQGKLAAAASGDLAADAVDVAGVKVLAAQLPGVEAKALRDMVDQLKNKLGDAVVMLATVSDGKVSLVAGVAKPLTQQVKAGELMKHVATQVGGKGGGRPDMAQGGGTEPDKLADALAGVPDWVKAQLS